MNRRMLLGIVAGLGLSAAPLLAHHQFSADFDRNKPVSLNGTVTKVEWTNPHAHVYMNVRDDQGKMTNWKVEMGSPADLERAGWTRTWMKVGNLITVNGWQGIRQKTLANADTITAAGKTLSAASSAHEGGTFAQNPDSSSTVGTSGTREQPTRAY